MMFPELHSFFLHGLSEARRLRLLEEENRKLKRLLAESVLYNAILKDLLRKV